MSPKINEIDASSYPPIPLKVDIAVGAWVIATDLFNLESPTQKLIDEHTALTTNLNSIPQSDWTPSHDDFEFSVSEKETIKWIALKWPENEHKGYTLKLIWVKHNDRLFFDADKLNPSSDGNIYGTISNKGKLVDNEIDKYTIKFSITHGEETKDFTIDPKLAIKS